jgi:hypothetical protein
MDPPRPPGRDWSRSVANTVITPPPPNIRIQQDESYPVPSIHAINYALQRLSAMKDQETVRFNLLDFTKCPIASIDILFPKRTNTSSFGLLDPPLSSRVNARALREWRRLGSKQQKSIIDSEVQAKGAAQKRSMSGRERIQRQTSRRKVDESVTPTPNDTGRANVTPTPTHESDDTPMHEYDDTPMPESDDTPMPELDDTPMPESDDTKEVSPRSPSLQPKTLLPKFGEKPPTSGVQVPTPVKAVEKKCQGIHIEHIQKSDKRKMDIDFSHGFAYLVGEAMHNKGTIVSQRQEWGTELDSAVIQGVLFHNTDDSIR